MSEKKTDSSSSNNSSCSDDSEDQNIDWRFRVFNNKYLCLIKIGVGSYCSVWLVFNMKNLKYYALKIYNRTDYDDAIDEINKFNKLKHIDNLVLYIETFLYKDETYDKFMCGVMELSGYSIYDIIKLFRFSDIKVNAKYIRKIILQSAIILNNLHKSNYIHTDIKPENILIHKPKYEHLLIFEKINNIIYNIKKNEIKPSLFSKNKDLIKVLDNVNNIDYDYDDDDDKYNEKLRQIYDYIFTDDIYIKICDLGTIMNPNNPELYIKHTVYYRSPEIILFLPYDYKYDIWSLGCSLYELLSYNILFDPHDKDCDRHHLHLISSYFGMLPYEMIMKSKYKYIFFTKSLDRIRTFKKVEFNSIIEKVSEYMTIDNYNDMSLLIDVMLRMLRVDPSERIESSELITKLL
jgi:serine/threonine protein kinase